jgi:hypothetical protein
VSAESTGLIRAATAIELIAQHAGKQADDLFQLFLDDTDRGELAMYLEEAHSILAGDVEGAAITSAEQEAALVARQGRAYKVERAIEDIRVRRVKPLQDEVKAVNDLLGTSSRPGGFVFGKLLARMGKGGDADRRQKVWRAAERQRIDRERAEAERARIDAALKEEQERQRAAAAVQPALKAQHEAAAEQAAVKQQQAELAVPMPQVKGVRTEDGKKTYHEVWTFEVINPADVPREYCVPSQSLLAAAVKAGKRSKDLPGVNVFQDERSRRGA